MLVLVLAAICASVSVCVTVVIFLAALEKDRANAFDAHVNDALVLASEDGDD